MAGAAASVAVPPRIAPLLSLRQLSLRRSQRALDAATAPAPIPVIGISIDGILDFIAHCRSTAPAPPSETDVKFGAAEGVTFGLDECSTEIVKRQWMLSATALPDQQSYCDLLKARGSPHVGSPSVFVSHAWRYKFLDVVAALENWLAKGGKNDGAGTETPDAYLAALLRKKRRQRRQQRWRLEHERCSARRWLQRKQYTARRRLTAHRWRATRG